jgi:hypothetical protein
MAGSGLAAPAPILAVMFALADGLRAMRFQRATGPAEARAGCRVAATSVATTMDE